MSIHIELHAPQRRAALTPEVKFQQPADCPIAKCSAISMYERELQKHRATEAKLRGSIAREGALRRQKDRLIQQKDSRNQGSAAAGA